MSDHSELKKLAEAATPGRWTAYDTHGRRFIEAIGTEDHVVCATPKKQWIKDSEYIAAADPVTVLALIAEVEALTATGKFLGAGVDILGPRCDQLKAEVEALRNPASKKTDCGHGHVYPSLSGYMARCGGPGLCAMCSRDAATKAMAMENQRIVPVKHECVKGYGHGGQWCGPDFNCWLDPRSKSEKNGHGKGCVCSVCTQ